MNKTEGFSVTKASIVYASLNEPLPYCCSQFCTNYCT